jgi:transcriptional regulator with XRE-family HTH domain
MLTVVIDTAGLVKAMRSNSGLSLRALAARAGTSAPNLVDYQAGRHEPKLSTLERLAEAAECDLVVEVRPRMTHAERRSLELHRAVAEKLWLDPAGVTERALQRLERIRGVHSDGSADPYLDAWEGLLQGPRNHLVAMMVSSEQIARDVRQASPFAGELTDGERLDIIQRVYEEERRRRGARNAA